MMMQKVLKVTFQSSSNQASAQTSTNSFVPQSNSNFNHNSWAQNFCQKSKLEKNENVQDFTTITEALENTP